MLKENDPAPEFNLMSDSGEQVSLDTFRGKKIVLYFYPRDNTPGCTAEACAFRDDEIKYLEKGAVVVGVSPDSAASHQRFRIKYNLPFYLVSDPDLAVAKAYGAWGEKMVDGKAKGKLIRSTFVINEDGHIIKSFYRVNPRGHSAEVLEYL